MAGAGRDDLVELFGRSPARERYPEDGAEVEAYVGSALPSDFKAFLDIFGTASSAASWSSFTREVPVPC
ncbi:hypothetical protein ACF07V_35090 [Streptomyces sp. NPDC015661]|uniref:hypothetical protein n=1 Tax=Streptomyces sp. NPDC015661 TaxID=3364961 RepID=UPI00370182DB